MKKTLLLVAAILFTPGRPTSAQDTENAAPQRVRIGVDVRLSFRSCMDSWLPVAEYLSKAIPDHRFVVVPLASLRDVQRTLEKGDVDFVVLDPAMEILANDRYGATPLLTLVETAEDETTLRPANAASSGTLIRRADRADIARIRDIRGQRLAAVKPWSLTGWIAQWGVLEKNGIDPHRDVLQVVFEGVNGQVVESVLNGSADVGAVDAEMLDCLIRSKQVSAASLCFFDRRGLAVPLVLGESLSSTDAYPGRVLCKTEATSNDLAQRVANALMKQGVEISLDHTPYRVTWSVACNYGKVRHLLQALMGPYYAESPGFPMPSRYSVWFLPAVVIGGAVVALVIAWLFLRRRYRRRTEVLRDQFDALRRELLEARAERQRINAILTLAGCGIDIVDDANKIVYADSGLERSYGDWHGRKCHEYYCGSGAPCPDCRRPDATGEQSQILLDIDGSQSPPTDDPHAKVHYIRGESTRMIGIPFRDEGGRWLYARIHFPLAAFAEQGSS